MDRKTILVFDDQPVVTCGLTAILSAEKCWNWKVIGSDAEFDSVVSKIDEMVPDMVVIDINYKKVLALSLIGRIRENFENIPVLVFGTNENMWALRSVNLGASGFLSKESSSEEILEAFKKIFRGDIVLNSKIGKRALGIYSLGKEKEVSGLTNRELEVLNLAGQTVDLTEIGKKLGISSKTAGTHRSHIRKKLEIRNNIELMRYSMHLFGT